jgi:hypothetical protein
MEKLIGKVIEMFVAGATAQTTTTEITSMKLKTSGTRRRVI